MSTTMWRSQCVHHYVEVPVCPQLCGGPSVSATMWRSQCVHHYVEVPVYLRIDVYVLSTHDYVHLEEMCLSFENYINVVCGM